MAKKAAPKPPFTATEAKQITAAVGKLGEACDNPNGLLVLDCAEAKALRSLILYLRKQIPASENSVV